MAMAIFRLMSGIPSDTRVNPGHLSFVADEQKVLNDWEKKMRHDMTIRVCGVRASREFKSDEDCEGTPIIHKNFKILHTLMKLSTCFSQIGKDHNTRLISLNYELRTGKIPDRAISRYDPGKVPSYLPDMSLLEQLLISKIPSLSY